MSPAPALAPAGPWPPLSGGKVTKFRWVRLAAALAAAGWCAWWWVTASPFQVEGTWLLTEATFHGYHAALLAGPTVLLAFVAWLLWPLARPPREA